MRINMAIGVFLVVALALAANFLLLVSYDPTESRTFKEQPPAKPFTGELTIRLKPLSAVSGGLSADIEMSFAVPDAAKIKDVAISYRRRSDGHRSWEYLFPPRPGKPQTNEDSTGPPRTLRLAEIRDSKGRPVDEVAVESPDRLLPFTAFTPPIAYPFDRYGGDLDVAVCVNSGGRPCVGGSNLFISRAHLECSSCRVDPALTPDIGWSDTSKISIDLRRQLFFRIVSCVLLLLAVVVMVFLVTLLDSAELLKGALGYFGALWALRSLIVPKDMATFPTAVEYTIFILFLFLFVITAIKLARRQTP